jgi:hypothetical protein
MTGMERITPELQADYPATPYGEASGYAPSSGWEGWNAFAGVMMLLIGCLHVIQGLVALLKEDYYVVTSSKLVVDVSYTTWGWTHVIFGAVVATAGVCVFAGQTWARIVGTIVAFASVIINVGFLSSYPIWSVIVIALDVMVILALTVHGSVMKWPEPR